MDNLYSEKIVQRVNELYHDFEKDKYEEAHPEIFEKEKARWIKSVKTFLNLASPITVIDIGTGTGFVPITIADLLNRGSTFICSDISKGILDVAQENLRNQNFDCVFKFVKIKSEVPLKLPFEDKTADAITLNSVLHHVAATENFLSEIDRVLKPGGIIFVGHEPNEYFYNNRFLYFQDYILYALLNPSAVLGKIFRAGKDKKYNKTAQRLNKILLVEKIIKSPLSTEEINRIVDVKASLGFKPDRLFPNYEMLDLQTYNHIYRVSSKYKKSRVIKKYEMLLSRRHPKEGQIFFLVARKP